MSVKQHRRLIVPVAAAAVVGLALTGCTGDIAAQDAADTDCAAYEDYGTFEGNAEVSIGGTIQDIEADRLVESWADFEACTGITVNYTGHQASSRRRSPFSPRVATPPTSPSSRSPACSNSSPTRGFLKAAPEAVEANVDEFWSEDWKEYGTASTAPSTPHR